MILKEAVLRRKISRARQTIKEECNYGRKKSASQDGIYLEFAAGKETPPKRADSLYF